MKCFLVKGFIWSLAFSLPVWGFPSVTDVRGQLSFRGVSDQSASNSVLTTVVMNGGAAKYHSTIANADGAFMFSEVSVGTYLLEVFHPTVSFDPVLVEVSHRRGSAHAAHASLKVTPYLYSVEHGRGAKLKHPLGLKAGMQLSFFEDAESLNIVGLLKSPLVIMVIISVVLMWIVPTLQQSVDPEELQQVFGDNESGVAEYRSPFLEKCQLEDARPDAGTAVRRRVKPRR